jgi:hypothetical protein
MCQLFSFSLATDPACLDIPNSNWHFFFFELHSRLLEDTLQKGSFPPADSLPYGVPADKFL